MGAIDDLPKRNVIYQGTYQGLGYDALVEKYNDLFLAGHGEFLGRNQECAALPQALTDVGYSGRWAPGPRVIDLDFLIPGTVIANFKPSTASPSSPTRAVGMLACSIGLCAGRGW